MMGNRHVRFLGEGARATWTPLPDKGRNRYHSFTCKEYGNGATVDNGYLVLSKIGRINVHWSRPIAGTPKTVTVSKEADGWYVSISCAEAPLHPLAFLFRVPAGAYVLRNLERRVTPADRLARGGDFLLTQRRAVRAAGVSLGRRAFADDGLGADQRRLAALPW